MSDGKTIGMDFELHLSITTTLSVIVACDINCSVTEAKWVES